MVWATCELSFRCGKPRTIEQEKSAEAVSILLLSLVCEDSVIHCVRYEKEIQTVVLHLSVLAATLFTSPEEGLWIHSATYSWSSS